MAADSKQYVYAFDKPPAATAEHLNALLGGKGANLVVMSTQLGLPVPPGFVITTEACRKFLGGRWPDGLDEQLDAAMDGLGARLGRRFGDPSDPLLVSVRSGAPVSMPGMMDTVLNLGLCEATLGGLAKVSGDEFAADCLERLREGYREVIGSSVLPDDPWQQLRAAVEAVFRSWNSSRAQAYRQREHIADDLGTAVTVQAMVFGNRGDDSGTGVLFTRNPSTGENELYGDFLFNAQGEDVVAGTHATTQLSVLGERLPEVGEELDRQASLLENHYRDLCDIEFTVEDGRLWLLQVRVGKRSPRAALRIAIDMAEDVEFPLTREEAVQRVAALLADPPRTFVPRGEKPPLIATGLAASPGIGSGSVVSSSAAAVEAADRGESVILVRPETSPEDVGGMARAAGVLTMRGGLASHAAVVARGWGIPAVVGADGISFDDGELITIDGSTGEVFRGRLEGDWETAPEAETLLGWAAELGIEIVASEPDDGAEAAAPVADADLTADDVLRAVAIKGSASSEQAAESAGSSPERVQPLVEKLQADGLLHTAAGQLRPTPRGKLRVGELFEADRARVGEAQANELLDEFHALDGRMKEIVTAWQVRDVAGEQALNDHSDAAYDAEILERLAALDADTAAWLAPLSAQLSRVGVYRSRLAHALDLTQGGDQRYVASPRVESYHGVWFELHEDLIRLAGKKRSDATSG